jgi:hypothetical protein
MPQIAEFATKLKTCFSSELANAIAAADFPGLQEGPHNAALTQILDSGSLTSHVKDQANSFDELESGLWLLAGDLNRSHTLSQDLPSAEGSFLHGIMHRREGDFGNAKYWFRQVGTHPVFANIAQEGDEVYDDPFDFVDSCRAAIANQDERELSLCVNAQWIEWQCLMEHICS